MHLFFIGYLQNIISLFCRRQVNNSLHFSPWTRFFFLIDTSWKSYLTLLLKCQIGFSISVYRTFHIQWMFTDKYVHFKIFWFDVKEKHKLYIMVGEYHSWKKPQHNGWFNYTNLRWNKSNSTCQIIDNCIYDILKYYWRFSCFCCCF